MNVCLDTSALVCSFWKFWPFIRSWLWFLTHALIYVMSLIVIGIHNETDIADWFESVRWESSSLHVYLSSFTTVDVADTIAADAALVRWSEILCFLIIVEVLGIALSTISLMNLAVHLGVFVTTVIGMHTLMTWYCHDQPQHLPDQGNYIFSVAFSKSCTPNDAPLQ